MLHKTAHVPHSRDNRGLGVLLSVKNLPTTVSYNQQANNEEEETEDSEIMTVMASDTLSRKKGFHP